ncbi:TerB family tellurite resistance protein [Pseudoalteromonas sp. SMS1]|uniref:TerB family tellurite resistance protein n=1 Tax=Pseudoalteromonas sp. SMS1 TaxID=2908894 RepID=UPI001F340EFF|nr:TerB family tellurite resistance protein [Pseudoalteromonas sp. SMS1]MCF2858386.1 TerB family tellurite resistance protein [Pseudoalteromonas sp. SMS1]
MHIILGVLGALLTILFLLNRLSETGFDIGWLNPFSWHRRRKFRKHHDLNPVFKLDSPLDVAALLATGVVKVDGDITATQKAALLQTFESEFRVDKEEAKDLLTSSVYLIGNGQAFFSKPAKSIERSFDKFTPEQVSSVIRLLDKMSQIDGPATAIQTQYIKNAVKGLPTHSSNKW